MRRKETNHKIVNLAVFCLAAVSCMNGLKFSHKKSAIETPKEKIENVEAKPYDWDNATAESAFRAGEIKSLEEFVKRAPHITDTIIINKDNYNQRLAAGIYLPNEDKVHLKCFIPDLTDCTPRQQEIILASVHKWNNEVLKMADKAHEYHHRYIHANKLFNLKNSAEDYGRLCAHNEIAAYTATLLLEREIVRASMQKGVPIHICRQSVSSRFSAYWDAVEQGVVHPENLLLNNEKLDNYLVIKTVFDWWMKNEYDGNKYISKTRLDYYMTNNPWAVHLPRNEKNYEKALDICYTFIKDGKIVNLNMFFKRNQMMTTSVLDDLPWGTEYKDIDNQPKIKELIAEYRAVPGSMLRVKER